MSKRPISINYALMITILITLVVCSCAKYAPPTFHTWDTFSQLGGETKGYAMYTYVLLGHNLTDASLKQRYQVLVDTIIDTSISPYGAEYLPKDETNIFYIPTKNGNPPEMENYNIDLSKIILNKLAIAVGQERVNFANHPGPFLVSSIKPLGELANPEEICILYTDLSNMNPDVVKAVTIEYKVRVSDKPATGCVEKFNNTFLNLMSLLKDFGDAFVIIKAEAKEIVK